MKIISDYQIRQLDISPAQCVSWVREGFLMKKKMPASLEDVLASERNGFLQYDALSGDIGYIRNSSRNGHQSEFVGL